MPDPTKPRCPVCHQPKPLRQDGTMQQHDALSGARVCGGTGREPAPAEETAGPDQRKWAVLDGLVTDQGAGDDDA